MYQFNYQNLAPEDKPLLFTCIVPSDWLLKNLPTMGGDVTYVDKCDKMDVYTDYVFEFTDAESIDKSSRTICMSLHHLKSEKGSRMPVSHTNLFEMPAKIHCRAIEDHDANNDWCIEVVLLNHFFGWLALSASMGNVYFDFTFLPPFLSESSEFNFEFGIGDVPGNILPGIIERLSPREAKFAFVMMFCKPPKRLSYFREAMNAFDIADVLLFSDVAVNHDKTLISALVGR